jgi:dTDP-4-amino-4,6-dideoxygalactose transaminase
VSQPLNVAEKIAGQIITLPTYAGLSDENVHRICDIIQKMLKNGKNKRNLL